jgi:hypothetical protein
LNDVHRTHTADETISGIFIAIAVAELKSKNSYLEIIRPAMKKVGASPRTPVTISALHGRSLLQILPFSFDGFRTVE